MNMQFDWKLNPPEQEDFIARALNTNSIIQEWITLDLNYKKPQIGYQETVFLDQRFYPNSSFREPTRHRNGHTGKWAPISVVNEEIMAEKWPEMPTKEIDLFFEFGSVKLKTFIIAKYSLEPLESIKPTIRLHPHLTFLEKTHSLHTPQNNDSSQLIVSFPNDKVTWSKEAMILNTILPLMCFIDRKTTIKELGEQYEAWIAKD